MRSKSTLILVLLAAVLALYFFFVEQPRHRETQQQAAVLSDLAAFAVDDAVRVTIERADATIELERAGGVWRMFSPINDRADDGLVNRMVGVFAEAAIARDLGEQTGLAPFGLDKPDASVTIVTASGDTVIALDIGDFTVDKYHAYAQKRAHGAGVLLVSTDVRSYILREVNDFRYNRVVEFDLQSVGSFTLRWPGRNTTWHRSEAGDWFTIADDDTVRGHKERVEAILRRLRGLRVREFVPAARLSGVQPFGEKAFSITVFTGDGKGQTVTVGRRLESLVYVKNKLDEHSGERVVLADTTVFEIFASTVQKLRDRRLFRFERARVTGLEIEAADLHVTLVRLGNKWGYPNPDMGNVDTRKINRILETLANIEYTDVADADTTAAESYGLSKSDIRITISGDSGPPLDRLVCTRATNTGGYLVTSVFAGVVGRIGDKEIDTLTDYFRALRDP